MKNALLTAMMFGCVGAAHAGTIYVHHLRVVANPAISLTDDDMRTIVGTANAILEKKAAGLSWDHPCPEVRLEFDPPILFDASVPASADMATVKANVLSNFAGYNLVVMSSVDCGAAASHSIGCSSAGEPFAIGVDGGTLEGMTLAHERGHSMGLRHATIKDIPVASAGSDGLRLMFWQLGPNHLGKKAEECAAFDAVAMASVKALPPLAASPTFAQIQAQAFAGIVAPAAVAPAQAAENAPEAPVSLEQAPPRGPLTPAAYEVIASPWEMPPVDNIKALSAVDRDSIRRLLAGPPSPLWAQAMTALALIGQPSDADFIRAPITYKEPPTVGVPDAAQRAIRRALLKARLTVPFALGILANQTKSEAPVAVLDQYKTMDQATASVGAFAALSFRMEALKGLVIADTANAKIALKAALTNASSPVSIPLSSTVKVIGMVSDQMASGQIMRWSDVEPHREPQLSAGDRQSLMDLQHVIETNSLDAALGTP